MPKVRHEGSDDEPVWLFETDPAVRARWLTAFGLAAALAAVSVVIAVRGTPWWLAGLPWAALTAWANWKLRDVRTDRQTALWQVLVCVGLFGGIGVLMLVDKVFGR